ncbi:exopolysaccharide biosynthesis protein, partial [Rhizobium rosettiformans]
CPAITVSGNHVFPVTCKMPLACINVEMTTEPLPVISLVVLAIGLMEKDGLITLVGVLLSIVAATVTIFLIYGAASVAGNVAR